MLSLLRVLRWPFGYPPSHDALQTSGLPSRRQGRAG